MGLDASQVLQVFNRVIAQGKYGLKLENVVSEVKV
jgi:hypothetical protein